MEDFCGSISFNYLVGDHMLTNFCQLAENLSNALPSNVNTSAIKNQLSRLCMTKEKWPDKIFNTWLNRKIPVFTQESIYKLIQSYTAWVEEVNESRKRQRDSLKVEMDRIKRSLDNVDQLRIKQIDAYQTLLLVNQAK